MILGQASRRLGLAILATILSVTAAPVWSADDDNSNEERELKISGAIGVTSDFVFRGQSQSQQDVTKQASILATYRWLYAGADLSSVDLVAGSGGAGSGDASWEVEWSAGIKPTYRNLTFDFGAIYKQFPNGKDAIGAELNYYEYKFELEADFEPVAISGSINHTPDYIGSAGRATTLEGKVAYALPEHNQIISTISGVIGTTTFGSSSLDYVFWNSGVEFSISERLDIDLRYWGTDNKGFCNSSLCDDRFVATVSVALE